MRVAKSHATRTTGHAFLSVGCGRFRQSQDGNVAIIFAIVLPVLILMAGGAIDFGNLYSHQRRLQTLADAASLAGAKELSLADANRQNITAVVESVVTASLGGNASKKPQQAVSSTTKIVDSSGQPLQVQVLLTQPTKSYFNLFDFPLNANSVAVVIGKPNVCLLALDPSAIGTIYLQKNAKIIGQNCGVYSNSKHSNGIKAFDSSMLTANVICSAGGKAGGQGNFTPDVLIDCPQFEDPLAGRPEPIPSGCAATNLVITSKTVSLTPGTYCGGIKIGGTAAVTFQPGIFIMKDGPLYVDQAATVSGGGVGFFFTGASARFYFNTGTTVSFAAPKNGSMAGMLFFGSRSQIGVAHEILSDNARQLLGTIYLPTGLLSIDANKPIADQSAYTAIVALKVTGNSGPTVTLNTNYDTTDVPVPDGIRGAGQPVALKR